MISSPTALTPRLDRIRHALACPTCKGDLSFETTQVRCMGCSAVYAMKDGRIYFIQPSETSDDLDNLKEHIRNKIGRLYYTLVWIISPCFFPPYSRQVKQAFDTSRELVIDLGSGRLRLDDSIYCVDFNDYPEVDFVCDIRFLPFKPGTIDGFVSTGVLEHVAGAEDVVSNMVSATKPGGRGLHLVPFMFPFHASPHDYTRWTAPGLRRLFSGFEAVRVESNSGPLSFFLLGLVEFLSDIASFGNSRIKAALYPLFCGITFPLKFLDLLFIGRPSLEGMTPLFVVYTGSSREAHDGGIQ
jgi:SAM-dependent methyltransferase